MKKFRITSEVKNNRYYFIISEVGSRKVISKRSCENTSHKRDLLFSSILRKYDLSSTFLDF
jgi:hypothetical protein|nr:MAG TPA: hypothetical protein [Caudoviricetes sp.]